MFGDERTAFQWLVSPCRALDRRLPLEVLASGEGQSLVEELHRLDGCVYE